MHSISVLAMLKNESSIINDWIKHYLAEGVDHFYLIDNGTTDDTYKILSKYEVNMIFFSIFPKSEI